MGRAYEPCLGSSRGGAGIPRDRVGHCVIAGDGDARAVGMTAWRGEGVADNRILPAVDDVDGFIPGRPCGAADEAIGRDHVPGGYVPFLGVVETLNIDVVLAIVAELVSHDDLSVGLQGR